MSYFALVVSAAIGGILNRFRGGALNDVLRWGQKTQASRAVYAIPTGLLAWYALGSGPWWLAAALVVSVFAGQAFFGNGGYLVDRAIRFPDWLGMARNFVSFAPAVFVSHTFLVVMFGLGAFHAAMYWAAFRLGGDSRHGEVIVGALTWGAIASFGV